MEWRESSREVVRASSCVARVAKTRCQQVRIMAAMVSVPILNESRAAKL